MTGVNAMIKNLGAHSFFGEVINKIKFSIKKGGAQLSKKTSPHKRMCSHHKASMTVEACMVLPFFLFAFLNIISIMDIFRIQGSMSAVMHDTAKEMALLAYPYKELTKEAFNGEYGFVQSALISETYAGLRASTTLKDSYPKHTRWVLSSILGEDDCIDLVAVYPQKPPISCMGYWDMIMINRLRTRAWTGFDSEKAASTREGDEEEIVYVAENGTVYHKSRACTHIKLSIRSTSLANIENERSKDESKYHKCENCGSKASGTVYVTDYGDRYHSSLSCSGLKRTISAVPISQVGDKGACSRCGGG
jgi:hypothetical protein